MSPVRLRSSMNRDEIIAGVGIHEPRWSRGARPAARWRRRLSVVTPSLPVGS